MNKGAVLEGLLFIKGEDGLTLDKIKEIMEIDDTELSRLIDELTDEYSSDKRGINLVVLGNKLKLATKKEHYNYYEKLVLDDDSILSQAALETLAIIAYNQPITRVKVDEIRGINSSHMIRRLLSLDLIKELGRSDEPGRPNLYGVTDAFLDYFGLSSTDELPKLEEIEIEDGEEDLFASKYIEDIDNEG